MVQFLPSDYEFELYFTNYVHSIVIEIFFGIILLNKTCSIYYKQLLPLPTTSNIYMVLSHCLLC